MEFSTYIVQLNDAILLENGPNLAYLLRPTSPHGKDLVKEFRNPTVGDWKRCNYILSIACD
jgi:COP9 signalosome complex subunit 12